MRMRGKGCDVYEFQFHKSLRDKMIEIVVKLSSCIVNIEWMQNLIVWVNSS